MIIPQTIYITHFRAAFRGLCSLFGYRGSCKQELGCSDWSRCATYFHLHFFLLLSADQFEMTLDEFYSKATNQPSRDFVLTENIAGRAAKYRQFDVIGENPSHTVKDSIHLDWVPLKPHCPECGVTVKMWDSFAHR